MINHGLTKSTIKPQHIIIDEYSVWVNNEITETSGEDEAVTVYEYNMVQYEKDEYLLLTVKKNDALETQLTDTQLALCEIYERMV